MISRRTTQMTTASIGPLLIGAHRNAHNDEANSGYWANKVDALALALLMTKEPEIRNTEIARKKNCILEALDAGVRTRGELYAAVDSTVVKTSRRRTY